jgi:hypothetical protein
LVMIVGIIITIESGTSNDALLISERKNITHCYNPDALLHAGVALSSTGHPRERRGQATLGSRWSCLILLLPLDPCPCPIAIVIAMPLGCIPHATLSRAATEHHWWPRRHSSLLSWVRGELRGEGGRQRVE